jgi:hypothetical protein
MAIFEKSTGLFHEYLRTFNSIFGRYRWSRMPFAISSASEVWRRRMHEFAHDLSGVEVIADEFLIAGFGETEEEVDRSVKENERAFFQKCRQWNLKLNKSKMNRRCFRFESTLRYRNSLRPARKRTISDRLGNKLANSTSISLGEKTLP